ncbi:MAG TPA: hypothetical protein VF794_38040 [Archangium sp.]|jgi:hypothetical protein|uniref:hypothetical protein n=1 Tax=Archangium sp. TaxID=1872627 RepID=UPI002ED84E21
MPLRAIVLVLSVVTFLVAAKTHGRQVRLERERAGHTRVIFGGENPPFVEALWKRDRIRFWSTAALVFAVGAVLVLAGASLGLPRPLGGGTLGAVWTMLFLPLVTGFVVCGTASLAGFLATRAVDPGFTSGTLPGSVAWWSLVLTTLSTTLVLAFRTAR